MNSKYLDTGIICENCAPHIYQCAECWLDIEDGCECIYANGVEWLDIHCTVCNKTHEGIDVYELLGLPSPDDEVEDAWDDDKTWTNLSEGDNDSMLGIKLSDFLGTPNKGTTSLIKEDDPTKPPKITYYEKCRHYNVPVEFADGTVIYASSAHDRPENGTAPDFGLYLDSCWRPACFANVIDWADYGLPKRYDLGAYGIIDAFNKARNGLWVEVGCIGGHGRTGTALACMAILGGMTSAEAVEHVRSTYCSHTIESSSQMWYIKWFEVFVNGGTIDEMGWDKKKKEEYVENTWEYSTPLEWHDYNPFADPTGKPPKRMQKTVVNKSFNRPWFDEKTRKFRYETIKDDDKFFPQVKKEFAVQEAARILREEAEAEAKAADPLLAALLDTTETPAVAS